MYSIKVKNAYLGYGIKIRKPFNLNDQISKKSSIMATGRFDPNVLQQSVLDLTNFKSNLQNLTTCIGINIDSVYEKIVKHNYNLVYLCCQPD